LSAWQAIQSLIALLNAIPSNVVPHDHIGIRRPSAPADLPRIVVAASGIQEVLAGIGGLVGSRPVSATVWSSDSATAASGTFAVEMWAADEAPLEQIADAVFRALADPAATSSAGFSLLSTSSVGPMDLAPLGSGGSSPSPTALRLPLECSFSFESVVTQQTGPGGIIGHIHVELEDEINEVMDLP